ncbi:radical SAM protein [soil metagenome]
MQFQFNEENTLVSKSVATTEGPIVNRKRRSSEDRDPFDPLWLECVWLEVTNRCNLQCVHCYADSGPYEPLTYGLQHSDWLALIDEISGVGCRKVQFIGGEPLLYPNLPALIEKASANAFEMIEVYTNGTRLTDDLCTHFRDHNVSLAFSFYSKSDSIHDSITKQKGSQERTLRGIDLALKQNIPVRVGVVQMSENANCASEAVNYLRSLGIQDANIDDIRGYGRGRDQTIPDDAYSGLCGACWRGLLAINSAGDVSPCVFSRFKSIGHVSEGIRRLLQKKSLGDFRARVKELKPSACLSCRPEG